MLTRTLKIEFFALCLVVTLGTGSLALGQSPAPLFAQKQKQLQHRIDFGNAYIMGQSIKSGAVYLLHRKQSDIKSMLQIRSDYREEIKEDYALEGTELVKDIPNSSEKK